MTSPRYSEVRVVLKFLKTKVSQGNVAIHLTCDGIFNHLLISNLSLSPLVKEF